jgi:hypothetical protein
MQSYIVTTARYDFSVYEKRIFYRIVEMMQTVLTGQKLNQKCRIDKQLFDLYEVEMPVSAVLINDEDTNHARIKEALLSMCKKTFQFEDDKVWRAISLIMMPTIRKYDCTITFRLHNYIYDALLNFSKGYKKYDLKMAMSFKSPYTMRMYELFSKQKTPLIYSVEQLKSMFGVEKKYQLVADFIRRVIEPAKRELDTKSPYSYEFELLKTGRKVTSIKFHPIYIAQNVDEETERTQLIKQLSPSSLLDQKLIAYLKDNFAFSQKEIKNNLPLFDKAQKVIPDLIFFLSTIKRPANDATNTQGYVVNALRKHMKIETPKEKRTKGQGLLKGF